MRGNEGAGRVEHAVRLPLLLPLRATILKPNLPDPNVRTAEGRKSGRKRNVSFEVSENVMILISERISKFVNTVKKFLTL